MLDPEAASRVMRRMREQAERSDPLAALTGQERKILELIGEGLTNRQIGERMYLAEKTVKNYVSGLFTKLGMERRTQAAAYAARVFGDDQPRSGYGRSVERDAPLQRGAAIRRGLGPHAAAERGRPVGQVGQAAAAPCSGLIPEPLSWTVSTRSRPPPVSAMDTATSGRVAFACRATLDRASRSTASRCSGDRLPGNRIQPAVQPQRRSEARAARSSARPG